LAGFPKPQEAVKRHDNDPTLRTRAASIIGHDQEAT